ncbi:MAG: sigma-70 family RNA polymerase sigma factor, partial [Planctomycetes bacterium]|nr:sigma-70 family RNA polymerase sigma factor [Planctomycetota bacterium]
MFRRHRDGVFRIAYRFTGNRDDALEITQDVFMKLIEHLGGFRQGSRFSTWLYRVSVNQTLDFLRRRMTGDYAVDEFGFDPELTDRILLTLARPLYRSWFRVEATGLDNV